MLLNDIREVLFGGAVGGGKSSALLLAALQFFDVPGYAALILRTSRQALALPDGLIPRSHEWLEGTGARWSEKHSTWTSKEGATLTFGYLEGPRDKYRYASSAYQFIGFEELTEWRKEDDYTFLFSRLRKPKHGSLANVPLRIRATTNPVGPGFSWVKRRFVDTPNTLKRVFLPSTLDDNPSLDTDAYEAALAELGPKIAEQLREGIWKAVIAGEIFDPERFEMIEASELVRELRLVREVRYWDLAATEPGDTNPDPDWTVGVHMGLTQSGRPVVVHVKRVRRNADGVEDTVKAAAQVDGKNVPVRISQDPAQAGKAQITSYTKLLAGWDIDGVRETGDKVLRAGPFAAQQRRGQVLVVRGAWNHDYFEILEGFPTAVHDDDVDASSGAYNFLMSAKPPIKIRKNVPLIR